MNNQERAYQNTVDHFALYSVEPNLSRQMMYARPGKRNMIAVAPYPTICTKESISLSRTARMTIIVSRMTTFQKKTRSDNFVYGRADVVERAFRFYSLGVSSSIIICNSF